MEYLVTWEIEVDADSPEDAAEQARLSQVDPDMLATFFKVQEIGRNAVKVEHTIEVGPNTVTLISTEDI